MKITKVTYYDIENRGNFLSKCSIVFDDCVMLHDVKILNGDKGRYIIMPEKCSSRKKGVSSENKESEDVFHPVRQSYTAYMKEVVLRGFEIYENEGVKVYNP